MNRLNVATASARWALGVGLVLGMAACSGSAATAPTKASHSSSSMPSSASSSSAPVAAPTTSAGPAVSSPASPSVSPSASASAGPIGAGLSAASLRVACTSINTALQASTNGNTLATLVLINPQQVDDAQLAIAYTKGAAAMIRAAAGLRSTDGAAASTVSSAAATMASLAPVFDAASMNPGVLAKAIVPLRTLGSLNTSCKSAGVV